MKYAILISVYNAETTLDRTFKSLRRQTFQDFRIIAINDCSTDRTLDFLKKSQEIFGKEKFTIINNEQNIGLTKSLNKGLAQITEPYTARIDADDWWHPDKLLRQISFLQAHPEYGIIGCNYINCIGNKQRPITTPETDEAIRAGIIRRNPFAHSCVIFDTALIRSLGGYDETVRYGQDYELWLRAYPRTKYYNLQTFLCYRSAEQGISMEKQREQMWQGIKTQTKYIRKYHLFAWNYFYTLEPFMLVITPRFIKSLKRRIFP